MKFTAYAAQRETRTMYARAVVAQMSGSQATSASVLPEGQSFFTVAKTATGVYVFNFTKPFVRIPAVFSLPLHASAKLFCTIGAASTSSVTINCWNDTGAAADATHVHLHVSGFDVADPV